MVATFTHPPGTDPALVVADAMIAVDHELTHLPVKSAMQMIESVSYTHLTLPTTPYV